MSQQENVTHDSGLVRGSTEGKIDYLLAIDGPMFERYAIHMTNAAENKGRQNWLNAKSKEDLERFRSGAFRHLMQWLRGDTDEDHAASIFFNVDGAEYVKQRLGGCIARGYHVAEAEDRTCGYCGEELWPPSTPAVEADVATVKVRPFAELRHCDRAETHDWHEWTINYGDGSYKHLSCPGRA